MVTVIKQIATAMVCVVTVFLAQSPAQTTVSAPDSVGKAWISRAEAATKKLASPGLDKCDKGVEAAFQHSIESTSGKQRSFDLQIEIDGQTMVGYYSYAGQRLTAFVLVELPPGWLAVQNADSKTLNILVEGSNCTFDICTSDPFTTGPCTEKRTR